jgi:response regulator RpfG family c-di-GMP phosphodiesterase
MTSEKKSILYVDDEFLNLELFKINFRDRFNVFTATSGTKGLEVLDKENIGVVISDLKMPGMSGLEFIEIVKSKAPQKVCILLSAYLETDIKHSDNSKSNIFKCVSKPWKKPYLQGVLETAFEEYEKMC